MESVSRLWGNWKKSFFRCQNRRRQCQGNLQSGRRWSKRCRPELWNGVKLRSLFQPRWFKKKVKGLHGEKTLMTSQGHLNDALTLWERSFELEDRSKTCPKTRRSVWELSFGISFLCYQSSKDWQLWAVPNRQCGRGPIHVWCTIQQNCGCHTVKGAKNVAVKPLAGVGQWIEHQTVNQSVAGCITSQGTSLGCCFSSSLSPSLPFSKNK